MTGRWDSSTLAECVHATRRLGVDPSLVLHGGGNSSLKTAWRDITGRSIDAIFVKGTGRDMATIEADGFSPLRLDRLREVLELDGLSDSDMVRELSAARLDPAAPQPSVEALLHAFLPHAAVLHTHADAIVSLTNLANAEEVVREVLGDRVVVVPYVKPGFDLARAVRRWWPLQAHAGTIGLVLLHHGLFTFGATSGEAYDRHSELLALAERWLGERSGPHADAPALPDVPLAELAELRRDVSRAAGRPLVLRRIVEPAVCRFVARPDLASLATRGPLTPDHVVRTKRVPMIGRDVGAFVRDYEAYFAAHARAGLRMLDPAPRIILDPELGLVAGGETADAARAAADIYLHTIPVLERAEDRLGGYVALSPRELFEVEYWELEQAKLHAAPVPPLSGAVAIVTGAASGIGRACARALLAAGAAVGGLDVSPEVEWTFSGNAWRGLVADVTDARAVQIALRTTVEAYGGIDIAVLAAGVFGPSAPLSRLEVEDWDTVAAVNARAAATLLHELHPLLSRSALGGRVAVVASKNVAAPGRGAAAYSASKAALTQLCRVAALEWAADGIRVNAVHPDAVFDTGLWTPELLAERAAQHGTDVEAYKRRNLLGVEIRSDDVAQVVLALCSDSFRATTGAQVPVDGGNERVI